MSVCYLVAVCLFANLLFVWRSVCLSVSQSGHPSIYPSRHPSVCQSINPLTCPSTQPSIHLPIHRITTTPQWCNSGDHEETQKPFHLHCFYIQHLATFNVIIDPSIHSSIGLTIRPSIHRVYPTSPIHPSTHPPTHLPLRIYLHFNLHISVPFIPYIKNS